LSHSQHDSTVHRGGVRGESEMEISIAYPEADPRAEKGKHFVKHD